MHNQSESDEAVMKVVTEALQLPPNERETFLRSTCGPETRLYKEAAETVDWESKMKDFLCRPFVADEEEPAPCVVGDVINNRFSITRKVGQGGMGVVFEAFDQKRQQRIAMKFARPGFGRLLSPELEAALKVRHPNVCLVNEIHSAETAHGEVNFLTMEFLDGESLASALAHKGKLPEQEAVAIAVQLCAGLDAAHRSGVIHRDLKAEDVILCHTETGAVRAVITDFGLSGEANKSGFFGTHRYLAPELLVGAPATYSTDIYALGVICFEMATGICTHQPDSAMAPFSSAPKSYRKVTAGFLSLEPERRVRAFQTAPALLGSTQLSRRQITGFGIGLAAAATGAVWYERDAIDDWLKPLPPKRFVALLAWPAEKENRARSLVNGAIEGIENELVRAESMDPNLFVTSVRDFAQSGGPRAVSLRKLTDSLGVNLALQLSSFVQAGNFGLMLNLLDVRTDRSIRQHQVLCSEAKIAALPLMAVQAAASLLHVNWQPQAVYRLRPATDSSAALQAFQHGRDLRNQPNDDGLLPAIESFKAAAELDGNYASAYTELAVSYHHLYTVDPKPGLLGLAMANVLKALQLDANNSDAHIELGMLLAEQGDFKAAQAQIATAIRLDPSNPRNMLRKGEVYEDAGEWALAEKAYRAAQRERPNYWFTYNNTGNVLSLTGRYAEAHDLFQIAVAAAPGSVMALTNLAETNFRLGRVKDAEEIYRKSIAIKKTDYTLQRLGDLLRFKKDYKAAVSYHKSAVELMPSNDFNWLALADCYEAMGGHQREAKEAFSRAAAEASRLISDSPVDRTAVLRLALYKMKIGDRREAQVLLHKPQVSGQLDLDSELIRVRILELSGKRKEALQTLTACVRRGPVRPQLEAVNDLADLRRDPAYARLF